MFSHYDENAVSGIGIVEYNIIKAVNQLKENSAPGPQNSSRLPKKTKIIAKPMRVPMMMKTFSVSIRSKLSTALLYSY